MKKRFGNLLWTIGRKLETAGWRLMGPHLADKIVTEYQGHHQVVETDYDYNWTTPIDSSTTGAS